MERLQRLTDMERQMMPTEDGVARPWNCTNPSPATPGVLTARCYAILHHIANKLLENSASLSRRLHTSPLLTSRVTPPIAVGMSAAQMEFNHRYVFHVDYSEN